MKHRHYIIFLLILLVTNLGAQNQYPIRTQTIITQPYPASLEDFYADGGTRMTLQVFANNTELSNYPVKFRLVLLGPGVEITTDPAFTPPQFIINGGENYTLSGSDLAAYFNPNNLIFKGYSKSQYQRTGRLPDGVYRLSFEVIFYYNNEISVASANPALIWLFQNEPPLLNFPADKEVISAVTTQNIMFSWTKRQSPFSSPNFAPEYKFELWEIWPEDKNANEIARSTRPIYSTTVKNTNLIYSSNEPLLFTGRRYAWRVQVFDPDGAATFKNDGLSEVRWFQFGKVCPVPVISVEKTGIATIEVKWDGDYRQTRYEVRFREKKRQNAQWYTKNTNELNVVIDNLKPLTDYEIQVCGFCDDQQGEYSNIATAATKAETNFTCGKASTSADLSNTNPLPKLQPKDFIKAGDFDIQITQVSGSNGTFSGKGLVLVPYLKYIKYEVEFKNIKVNDEYRLIDGSIYTVYNLNNALVLRTGNPTFLLPDPKKPVEENAFATNNKIVKASTDTTITQIEFLSGAVRYTTANGEIVTVRAGDNEVVAISNKEDKDATQYVADTKTNTLYSAKPETKGSTTNTTNVTPQPKSSGTTYTVTFARHNQQDGGFDAPSPTSPAENYQSITIDGKQQLVPWKSIEAGRADRLKAKVTGGPVDSVRYRRESQQLVMTAPGTADTVQLMLSGQGDMEEDNLYAWYPEYRKVNDTVTTQDRVLAGQVNLVSYDKMEKTVYLVPVNGCQAPGDIAEVQTYLNSVYAQALVKWNVQKISDFRISLKGVEVKKIDNTDVDNSMSYTADMKAVIEAFRNHPRYDNDACYLFFFDDCTKPGAEGYMPFNKQLGFIYKYKQASHKLYLRTIAHELGHGPFRLYHNFSPKNKYVQAEGTTDNLMDYPADKQKALSATKLQKYQWDEIHSWHVGANWLEEEDEGEAFSNEDYFLDPTGYPFKIYEKTDGPNDKIILNTKGLEVNPPLYPNGSLWGFSLNNIDYEADISNGEFKGYKTKNGTYYVRKYDNNTDIRKVKVVHYFGNCTAKTQVITLSKPKENIESNQPVKVTSALSYNATRDNAVTISDCGKTGDSKKIPFSSENRNENTTTLVDYSGIAGNSIITDDIYQSTQAINNKFGINSKIYIINQDRADFNQLMAEANNDATPNKYIFIIESTNKPHVVKLQHQFSPPQWFMDLLPNVGVDNCVVDYINEGLEKLHSSDDYTKSSLLAQIKAEYSVAIYNGFFGLWYCATSEEAVANKSNFEKYMAGVTHELLSSIDIVQMIEGIKQMVISAVETHIQSYDSFFSDIRLTYADLKNNKSITYADLSKRLMPPGLRTQQKILETVHKVGKNFIHLYFDCDNTLLDNGKTANLCAYRLGEVTVMIVPAIFSAGQYAIVKAQAITARIAAKNLSKAKGVAELLKQAEEAGYKIEKKTGQLIIKDGDNVVTTIEKKGNDIEIISKDWDNLVQNKLGHKPDKNLDFTDFRANTDDKFIDVVIHYKDGKFVISKEGMLSSGTEMSIDELAKVINETSSDKSVRLLSCNDLEAAEELSRKTSKPFYASDGWVDLYKDGTVTSEKPFHKFENGKKGDALDHNKSHSGSEKIRLGDDLAKGVTRHPNWVEVLDIRTKILAKKSHVLEIEGLNKTRNYRGTTLEGFTGCHSTQALDDHISVNGGTYRINGKPTNLHPDEVFEGQPIITINGKDYVKTNGQPIVEYSPGKYGGTSTFFPENWDNARILDEVEYAIANNHGVAPGNNPSEYFGFSRDGKVEIHFYLNTDGSIGSYFPKKR